MPATTMVGVSSYEKCREERIKENQQRMQNLGILDLSLKLKSQIRPSKRTYTRSTTRDTPLPLQLSVSTRRSSRLKNTAQVAYFEEPVEKKGKAAKQESLWLGEGERPEIYTDEHEKLLGNTERSWEFFVDGYAKDGKRIYDPVRGKTCHQCRLKTLGYRTQCSRCHPSVTGQFCGDCLYMRYGEHVLETLENPDWLCPGCRGICNCSLCRKHKGWLPTGAAYRKISKLGYKSVAHYLIQTNKQTETGEEDETDATANSQASAKRSLSVKEANASSEEQEDRLCLQITDVVHDNHIKDSLATTAADDDGTHKDPDSANQVSVIDDVGDLKPLDVKEMDPGTPVIIDVEAECKETKRSKRKISVVVEPNPNSIGGRLRQRRKCQA
ncbi:unnamed protein product [Cochlearia groenlandica]